VSEQFNTRLWSDPDEYEERGGARNHRTGKLWCPLNAPLAHTRGNGDRLHDVLALYRQSDIKSEHRLIMAHLREEVRLP
jgi:hypothetical protein